MIRVHEVHRIKGAKEYVDFHKRKICDSFDDRFGRK